MKREFQTGRFRFHGNLALLAEQENIFALDTSTVHAKGLWWSSDTTVWAAQSM